MSLAQPGLLLAAPVVLALLWLGLRRSAPTAGAGARIARLWADRRGLGPVAAHRRLRGRGLAAGLGGLLVVVALAHPLWGVREEIEVESAREVLLALDLSRSMLAEDVAPSRLARARLLIEGLLGELRGERVGLVLFAGTAFLQCPLSADYEVLRDLLAELDVGYLPQGGTDYGAMLDASLEAFGQQADADRFLIVLSDGESHDTSWRERLPRVRERGLRVLALGIGSEAGSLVPDGTGGVVKDERGAAVLSRLEPRSLRELAEASDGVYRDAASWVDLGALVEQTVARGRRGDFAETRSEQRIERFQWLLAPGLALLLLSFWLELPAAPAARRLARAARAGDASRAGLAAAIAVLAAFGPLAAARSADVPPSDPLLQALAELTARPLLSAADYSRLAEATVEHATAAAAGAAPSEPGVIDDGLLAVAVGERLDPAAADWADLRRRLETLVRSEARPAGSQPEAGSEGGAEGEGEQEGASAGESASGDPGPRTEQEPGSQADEKAGEKTGDGTGDDAGDGAGERADDSGSPSPAGSGPRDAGPSGARGDALGAGPEPRQEPAPEPAVAAEAGVEEAGAAAQTPMRLLGGSGDSLRELLTEHPELAAALGRMEKVRGEDSPSRLFQRLDEAEGRRSQPTGRDW